MSSASAIRSREHVLKLFTRFSFHPVGQGIFSTGSLSTGDPVHTDFRWAYDCGSVKRWQRQLEQEIERFARLTHVMMSVPSLKPKLDLVFVSHFDLDHISGLVQLLQAFDVEALVMPYIPLWQRVVAAVHSKRFDTPTTQAFFTNPVGFISGLDGINVARIILVPSSTGQADDGDSGPIQDLPGGYSPEEDFPGNRPPMQVSRLRETPFDGAHPEEVGGSEAFDSKPSRGGAPQVQWMDRGGRLVANGCWEFVPYNNPTPGLKATPEFRLAVCRLAGQLLLGAPAQRAAVLAKLKANYTARFGTSSKNKNEISLFVFAGPTFRARWDVTIADQFDSLAMSPNAIASCDSGQCPICSVPLGASSKAGVLYTGDGFLATEAQFDSLSNYLGSRRMSTIGTLQVMHHGSRKSSRSGLAGRLAPNQSVFCADPSYTHRHPHREVWEDFESFGRVLVDAKTGMTRFQES